MSHDFGDYVRSLEPTGEPSDAALDQLWTALRRRLRRTLQRRGLWDRQPAYLGVTGHTAWTTPGTANRRGFPKAEQDALDELTTDFYVEVFVKRLPSLRRYARRGDNLEKIVRLGAGQFIQERQRQNDRLGYRLFQWLRTALAQAVTNRRLYVLAGDVKIRNETVLGFDPAASAEPASEDALAGVVRSWNDALLYDWITARGAAVTGLIDRLEERLPELRRGGVEVVGFKSLVDVFKHDVRARLGALLGDVDVGNSTDPLRPGEERQRIEELSECVQAGLQGGGGQQRTRDKLLEVWRFLIAFALTAVDPERVRGASAALMAALQGEDLPSHRELSRLLNIRHDRFPALLARIKDEVERCLETLGRFRPSALGPHPGDRHGVPDDIANTDTLGASAGARGSEANLDDTRDLRQELKRLTAEAYRRGGSTPSAAVGPEVGALYHLEACPEPGIEWLLVEIEAATGDGLAVPADTLPLLGSSDLAIGSGADIGHLSLRCDFGVWLGSDVLRGERRTTALAVTELDRIQARRHTLATGEATKEVASEIDVDPDYRGWRRSLEAARNAVARVYGGRVDEISVGEEGGQLHRVELMEIPDSDEPEPEMTEKVQSNVRLFKTWRSLPSKQLLNLAASAAVVLASGVLMGHLFEKRRFEPIITDLEVGLRETQANHDALLEQLQAEQEPEAGIPWLLAPFSNTRGTAVRFVVPSEARSIALLIDAANGDRLEIRDAAGDEVWSATVERIDSPDEALVSIPAARMPPGTYSVKVWRGDVSKVEFEVRIESP